MELHLGYHVTIDALAVLSTTYALRWWHWGVFLAAITAVLCISAKMLVGELVSHGYEATVIEPLFMQMIAVGLITSTALFIWLSNQSECFFVEYEARIEASAQQSSFLLASRRADSRLNHIIKGKCGSSIQSLQLFEGALSDASPPLLARALPPAVVKLLRGPITELRRAISWCHRRELFVQIEEGVYQSELSEVDFGTLLRALGCDRVHNGEHRARVDVRPLEFSIEEALSNAHKYRSPGSPIVADVDVAADGGGIGVRVVSQNQKGMPPMSHAECARVLVRGCSGEQHAGRRSGTSSTPSDGLGLDSACKVVEAAGGRVHLSACWEGTDAFTTFHVWLPAVDVVSKEPKTEANGHANGDARCSPHADEGDRSSSTAVADSNSSTTSLTTSPTSTRPGGASVLEGLRIVAIDDDAFVRIVYETWLTSIGADPESSVVVDDMQITPQAFADLVMGAAGPTAAAQRPADVAFLDLNISDELNGLDLATRLHNARFEGVICLMTGTTGEVLGTLGSSPVIDLVVEKGVSIVELKAQLTRAIQAGASRPRIAAATGSSSVSCSTLPAGSVLEMI